MLYAMAEMNDELDRLQRFGIFISRRRDELGLNQEDVAKSFGTTKQTISLIEAGKNKTLRADTFLGLSKALKIDLGTLAYVYETGKFPDLTNESAPIDYSKSIITFFKSLPREEQIALLGDKLPMLLKEARRSEGENSGK